MATTDEDKTIGSHIITARQSLGMSRAALGDVVGVSQQQIQKYEVAVDRVSAAMLKRIADALGKPLAWFHGAKR